MLDDESWQDATRRIHRQIPVWDDLNMKGTGRQDFIDEVNRIREEGRGH
jgi:hypothetical protein